MESDLVVLGICFLIGLVIGLFLRGYCLESESTRLPYTSSSNDHILRCIEIPSSNSSLVGLDIEERFVGCSSRDEAYNLAKAKSRGRGPKHHERPHKDGQQSHFHPHKHWYAVENGRFVNYHYCYGPPKAASDGRILTV